MEKMILVVAEKPSVARDIARVLGCKTKADGYIQGEKYIVTWAIGHLVSLCDPDELNPEYKKWRMDSLPILPESIQTKVLPKTRAQFSVLKKLMNSRDVSRIICATDSGREGELIFRLIYDQANCKKPFDRLWISSMTDAAIREGFERLRPGSDYDALYRSARCRSEADWLVGMNASRAFTLKYNTLLSVGRVQTPTLNLIVERDLEIEKFVPQDYWEVRADFGDYTGLWLDKEKNEMRCYNRDMAIQIKKEATGQTGTVVESKREKKRTPPPQLFDLTSLQREANKVMGVSAQKTLTLAQSLYEQRKLITYPRTDSRYLPRDMIPKIRSALTALPQPYTQWTASIVEKPPITTRMYNDSKVTDHHAIVPTGHKADLDKLPPDERKLFDIIARRLIAAHYPDYEYESVQILTQVNPHIFKTAGVTPLREGWRALYQGMKDEGEEQEMPYVAVGETRLVRSVSVKALKTKPPAQLTDATLLYSMERAGRKLADEELQQSIKDSGLGTPATRAATIERLLEVGYTVRKGKTLVSTEKGRRLIEITPDVMSSAEMTGRWEKALSDMVKSNDTARLDQLSDRFMDSIRKFTTYLVDYAKTSAPAVQFDPEERTAKTRSGKRRVTGSSGSGAPKQASLKIRCPVCHEGEVMENTKAFGCSRWREGCKFTMWKNALTRGGGPELTKDMAERLLKGETITWDKGSATLKEIMRT